MTTRSFEKADNTTSQAIVITIDGPAASGKTSVSRELADRLGWPWVSTGAFYRGLAYVASQLKTDMFSEKALVDLAVSNKWSVEMTPEKTCVLFAGQDVTDEISREEIGNLASKISSYKEVRKALLDAQRQCAKSPGLVAEGRDCGTVVFPQAPLKIFLTARAEDRAARRAKDEGKSVTETQDAQRIRDAQDANRKTAPLAISEDAHVIDTSELNFMEVVHKVEDLVRAKLGLLQE